VRRAKRIHVGITAQASAADSIHVGELDWAMAEYTATSMLLTIIIPTFNRARHLQKLLDTLEVELRGLEDRVTVTIGDNASTDTTPKLTTDFSSNWTGRTIVLRHVENVGPEENFCRCIERADTPYFWIIGDDDLPRAGVIVRLLALLHSHRPELVYLNSRWIETTCNPGEDDPVTELTATTLNRDAFARRVYVWTTFISGSIVDRRFASALTLRRFMGTSLVQLGWVMEALKQGERFIHVETPCILATSGNTGGYSVLNVFANNFQRITKEVFCGSKNHQNLARAIVLRTTISFLPGLVWGFKKGTLGSFENTHTIKEALSPQLADSWPAHIFLRPLQYLPAKLAQALLFMSKLTARIIAGYDNIIALMKHAAKRI
jgi:glycosyltransferase involved in cell wall biosynthesis